MTDKEPEIGDVVCVSGVIVELHRGTAIVDIFRPAGTTGLRIAVQVGGLELKEWYKKAIEPSSE